LNVRIPIFNGYSTKFRLTTAQINQKQSEIQADNVRLLLRQDIDQAYVNFTNSTKRYTALGKQVTALEESFRAAEAKFNVGSLNALDYSISKTNLDRARINQIQAKYDYIFRIKILDYYQNKPLSF
jgi:outer membrane protein